MAYTPGDPVYLPQQHVRRGVAGYKNTPAVVVDSSGVQTKPKPKPSK